MRFFAYVAGVAGAGVMILGLAREAVLLQNSLAEASLIKGGTLYRRERPAPRQNPSAPEDAAVTESPVALVSGPAPAAEGCGKTAPAGFEGTAKTEKAGRSAFHETRIPNCGTEAPASEASGGPADDLGSDGQGLAMTDAPSAGNSIPGACAGGNGEPLTQGPGAAEFNLKVPPAAEEEAYERLSGLGEGDPSRASGFYRKAMKARAEGNQNLAVKFYVRALEESREVLMEDDEGLADAAMAQARERARKNPGENDALVRLAYLADILGTREESADVYSRLALASRDSRVTELSISRAEAASSAPVPASPSRITEPEPLVEEGEEISAEVAEAPKESKPAGSPALDGGIRSNHPETPEKSEKGSRIDGAAGSSGPFDSLGSKSTAASSGSLTQVEELGEIASKMSGGGSAGSELLAAAVMRGDFVPVEPAAGKGNQTPQVSSEPPTLSDAVEKAIAAFRAKNSLKGDAPPVDALAKPVSGGTSRSAISSISNPATAAVGQRVDLPSEKAAFGAVPGVAGSRFPFSAPVVASGGRRKVRMAPPEAFSDSSLGFEAIAPASEADPSPGSAAVGAGSNAGPSAGSVRIAGLVSQYRPAAASAASAPISTAASAAEVSGLGKFPSGSVVRDSLPAISPVSEGAAMPAAMAGMRRMGAAPSSGLSSEGAPGLSSGSALSSSLPSLRAGGPTLNEVSGTDGYRFLRVLTISRDNDTFIKRFSGIRTDGAKAVGALEITGHWSDSDGGMTSVRAACGALGTRGERAVDPSDREFVFTGPEGYMYRVKLLDMGRDEARVAVEVRNSSVPSDARG